MAAAGGPGVHADASAGKRRAGQAGVFQGAPGLFEKLPLHRIHGGGLARRQAEKGRIEALRVHEKAGARRGRGPIAAAVGGHRRQQRAAFQQRPPEFVRVGGGGEFARIADDGDGLGIGRAECVMGIGALRLALPLREDRSKGG
ncbi:hypothetical protein MoryE10_19030 [Methylogaea oryzae]|uniref:Uncharacterized protein n=1 Tax=Methylogaea oryzae TaxID=1295382 RepID=A0A8D4VQB4_9GAMM|nr:hypothetical protein MoryE10_19030 [Methylogaea oryzae]